MSDELVKHRFIQIHQAYESASTQGSDAWSSLALKSTSVIAASHVCDNLVNKVITSGQDILLTIQTFQNLIITCIDTSKNIVFLRVISRLLMYNNAKGKISFAHIKYIKDTDLKVEYQVHPYVVLMRQKPSLYYNILDEIDFLFTNFAPNDIISSLSGFITAIFWTENTVDENALVTRLNSNINHDNANKLIRSINKSIKRLLHLYPLHKDNQHYFCLVDWIDYLYFAGTKVWNVYKSESIIYKYSLFDRLLTAVTEGQSGVPYLIRIERILKRSKSTSMLKQDLLWASLAYVLLKAQTLEEQKSIIRIMTSLDLAKVTAFTLRTAYIPLFQLLSELSDKSLSKELADLKKDVIGLLSYLENATKPLADDKGFYESLDDEELQCSTHGILGRIACYLQLVHIGNEAPVLLDEVYEKGTESVLCLDMLFSTPFVFYNDNEGDEGNACLVYSGIAEISSLQETYYKFPVLLFLLRRLHESFGKARIVTHILRDVIPTLVDVNDPIITSKVLQLILASINNSGAVDSTMASLGIKALAHTYKLQPRVWQELKKVFSEWVLRRKSGTLRRKIDLTKSEPIKMELSVLTTMRDVCKTRHRECAPDVLPMIISLLQTCQDLSMASLSIMVDIINSCVEADFVESRSIWNIAVVYIAQFSFDAGIEKSVLLIKQLCRFYAFAGASNDMSEPYFQFKESLLQSYILPLIESRHEESVSDAMYALSKFTAQDIMIILPEKAADYVLQCTAEDAQPNKNQHKVLANLMSNELDHMRRGLFNEEAKQQRQKDEEKSDKVENGTGSVVGERELEMESSFMTNWEDARVAPGLRSGYASAILHLLDLKNSPDKPSNIVTLESISRRKWYRYMVTSFTDVSLTDHLLLRVSSVQSWQTFFKNSLSGAENDMEAIVALVLKDLLSRLERSTVPGVTCNIALAITGLVSTIRLYIPSFAASCAQDIIEVLMKNYIVISGSPLSHSAHLMSEEVQFAARFALGNLAAFIISNEKLAISINNILMDAAVSPVNKARNIDTAVDLVQFATGYSAGHFTASVATWPAVTEQIENMKNVGMSLLIKHCGSSAAADSRTMGIMMGLASKLKPTQMGEELNFAINNLKRYLAGEGINKGLLFGSTWLAAAGAMKENHIDMEISSIVESVMTAASRDIESAQHFYNFSVPYTQIQLHSYLYSKGQQAETFYWNSFGPLLHSIETDDASSNYRIASLFSLGSLLGVNYLNLDEDERVYTKAEKYRPELIQPALDKLAYVAGVNSKSAPVGNLKSARVAAAICGKVIGSAKSLIYALSTTKNADESTEKNNMLSTSSEPVSYSRLNNNTSYLRAVFDRLVTFASDKNQIANVTMLLNSLLETPGPLPPVNWFSLITKISKLETAVQALCLSFAATHAATSLSLSEFLLTQMTSIFGAIKSDETVNQELCHTFFVGKGLSSVLELAGLPRLQNEKKEEAKKRRGMSAVTKRISLSESRAIEIIQLLGQKFQYFNDETRYTLLCNLSDHLPTTDTEGKSNHKFITSIRNIVMENMTQYGLDEIRQDDRYESDFVNVIQKSVACSLTDISQLLPTAKIDDWKDLDEQKVFAKVVALCGYYRLNPAKKQQLVKYISTAMTYIIGMEATDQYREIWLTLAKIMEVKDIFSWTIRILDAFVVYLGASSGEHFAQNAIIALNEVLSAFGVTTSVYPGSFIYSVKDLKPREIAYSLGNLVDMAKDSSAEQDQLVKRIFRLRDIVDGFTLFDDVILTLPSNVISQYESKIY